MFYTKVRTRISVCVMCLPVYMYHFGLTYMSFHNLYILYAEKGIKNLDMR